MTKHSRLFLICSLFLALLCLCGCQSTVRVSGHATRPYEYPPMRFDGSCWKETLWEDSNAISPENKRHTIAAVRYRTNYFYALATVLTFGIWTPVDIEWEENDD